MDAHGHDDFNSSQTRIRETVVNYTPDPLIWDTTITNRFVRRIELHLGVL